MASRPAGGAGAGAGTGSSRRSGRLSVNESAPSTGAVTAAAHQPASGASVRRPRSRQMSDARPSASRSHSRSRSGDEAADEAEHSSGSEDDDALVDTPTRATRSAASARTASDSPSASEMATAASDADAGDQDESDEETGAVHAAQQQPASRATRETVDLMDESDGDDGDGDGEAEQAEGENPATADADKRRTTAKLEPPSERKSARSPFDREPPVSPIATRRSSERKSASEGGEGSDEEEESFEFADLSTPAQRYVAMMRHCPPKEALVRLVRLVARPAGEEDDLVRDPLMVAKLYYHGSSKNLQRCSDFLRHFTKQPSCQAFLERLTDRKLKSYETSLRAYLDRTGGIAPIDFSSIAAKLAATKPDSVPHRDREGFAPCFGNSVAAVVVDLCNVVLNACKFNPPGHFVHEQALDLADKLPKALGALRRQLKIDDVEIVCYMCGNGDSDEDSAHGVLMQCESCSLWYHQSCAEVAVVPRDSWYCQGCVDQNPKLSQKRARQAAALYASVADQAHVAKQRAFSPAPRTQSRNDGGASAAAAAAAITASPSADATADAAPASGSKRKDAPSSASDAAAAAKKARNDAAVASASRSHHKGSGAPHRAASPTSAPPALISAVAVPAAAASSPPRPRARANSPDGRWMRLQSLAIKDRTPGGGGLFNPVVDSGTDDAAAVAAARGDDDNELRTLRTQLDTAMRTLAASSERLVDLQEKQRARARRAVMAKSEQSKQAAALQQIIDTLTAPVEPDFNTTAAAGASSAAATSSPAAAASSSAAAAAAAPAPSGEDLSKRLASYRHRFASLTRLVSQQKAELESAHKTAAALALQYDEVRAEAAAIQAHQQQRASELEHALSTLKTHLVSERRTRNDLAEQFAAQARLTRRMVDRLDLTVVGSPIPAQFGSRLLAEVSQAIERDTQANKKDAAMHAAAAWQVRQPEAGTVAASAAAAASQAAGAGASPMHTHPPHRHQSHGHSNASPYAQSQAHMPAPNRQGSGQGPVRQNSLVLPQLYSVGGGNAASAAASSGSAAAFSAPAAAAAASSSSSSSAAAAAAASPAPASSSSAAAAASAAPAPAASDLVSRLLLSHPHLFPQLQSLHHTLATHMVLPTEAGRRLMEQQHAQLVLAGVYIDMAELRAYIERQNQSQQFQELATSLLSGLGERMVATQSAHLTSGAAGAASAASAAAAAASSPRNVQPSSSLFGPSAVSAKSSPGLGGSAAPYSSTAPRSTMQQPTQQQQTSSQQQPQQQQAPPRYLSSQPSPPTSASTSTSSARSSAPAFGSVSSHVFGPSSMAGFASPTHRPAPSSGATPAPTSSAGTAPSSMQAQAQQQQQAQQRSAAPSSAAAAGVTMPALERPQSGSSGAQPPAHSWSTPSPLHRPPPPAPQHSHQSLQNSAQKPAQQMLPAPSFVSTPAPAATASPQTNLGTQSQSNTAPPPLLYSTHHAQPPSPAAASTAAASGSAANAALTSPPAAVAAAAAPRASPPALPSTAARSPVGASGAAPAAAAASTSGVVPHNGTVSLPHLNSAESTVQVKEEDCPPPDLIPTAQTK